MLSAVLVLRPPPFNCSLAVVQLKGDDLGARTAVGLGHLVVSAYLG